VTDRAIALFAGINVVPKRSYLAAYSSRIARRSTKFGRELFREYQEVSDFTRKAVAAQNHLPNARSTLLV
jgi:hypothetical protein